MEEQKDIRHQIVARFCVLLLPVVLIVLQAWNPDPHSVGLWDANAAFGSLTYHFFHANWFHLALNWWCLVGLVTNMQYKVGEMVCCYMIAATYPFLPDVPIVGLSGFIFAMAGLFAARSSRPRYIAVLLLASIGITAFLPNLAAELHLWCFLIAYILGFVNEWK